MATNFYAIATYNETDMTLIKFHSYEMALDFFKSALAHEKELSCFTLWATKFECENIRDLLWLSVGNGEKDCMFDYSNYVVS